MVPHDWDLYILVPIMAILMTPFIVAPAVLIRALVRWVNRRDDPRHQKRPLDPP